MTCEVVAPTSGLIDDPINASNGNMIHHELDVELPAIAAALNVERTWNSLLAATPGAFGAGWSSMLDVALDVAGDRVVASLADGNVVAFVPWGGGWVAPGVPRLRLSGDESRWELQTDTVRRFLFDRDGALTGWEVGVARVAIDRDADGRITTLTEHVTGRSLQVHWSRTGVVDELVADDDSGRSLPARRGRPPAGCHVAGGLRRVPLGRRPADRGRRRRRRRRLRQRVRRPWAGDDADQSVRAGVVVPLRRHRSDRVLRCCRRRPGDAPRPVRQPDGDHRRRRHGDEARLRRGAAGRAGRRAGRSDVALPVRRRRPRRARRSRRLVAALGVGRPASPRRDDRPIRGRHPPPVRHRAPGAVAGRRPRRLGRRPDPGRARAAGRDRRRRRCRDVVAVGRRRPAAGSDRCIRRGDHVRLRPTWSAVWHHAAVGIGDGARPRRQRAARAHHTWRCRVGVRLHGGRARVPRDRAGRHRMVGDVRRPRCRRDADRRGSVRP